MIESCSITVLKNYLEKQPKVALNISVVIADCLGHTGFTHTTNSFL